MPANRYSFITAVKEYAVNYLEYWCHNIDLSTDKTLDMIIDSLEIYGLNVFTVEGAYNSLMVYFRPMSLERFQAGEADISPDIRSIQISVDGQIVEILSQNHVEEYTGDIMLKAFLMQVSNPNEDRSWKELTVFVFDKNNNCGAASIYH